jgi:hypothetical protein
MARKLRIVPEGGGLFEITCRTVHGRLLFRPGHTLLLSARDASPGPFPAAGSTLESWRPFYPYTQPPPIADKKGEPT